MHEHTGRTLKRISTPFNSNITNGQKRTDRDERTKRLYKASSRDASPRLLKRANLPAQQRPSETESTITNTLASGDEDNQKHIGYYQLITVWPFPQDSRK